MGRVTRTFVSAAIIGGAAAFTWVNLLDERAKTSLKRAGASATQLANHFLDEYVGGQVVDGGTADATQRNKEWVEEQWRQAGF